MPRNITVTFDDGSSHVYQNAPDDVTPDQVSSRAQQEFGKQVKALDGGRGQTETVNYSPEPTEGLRGTVTDTSDATPPRNMLSDIGASVMNAGAGVAQGLAAIPDALFQAANGVQRVVNSGVDAAGTGLLRAVGADGAADWFHRGAQGVEQDIAKRPTLSDLIEKASPTPEWGGTERFLGQMVGGAMVPMGPKTPKLATIPETVSPTAARDIVNTGKQVGVRVMTSDVKPPKTFIGKNARSVGEKIPFIGTGGTRAEQQGQRVQAVKDVLREYGGDDAVSLFDDTPGALEDVAKSLSTKRGNDLSRLSGQKNAIIDGIKGVVPVDRTLTAIDRQITRLEGLRLPEYAPVINKLQGWREAVQNQGLRNIEEIRKAMGTAFDAPDLAGIKTTGQKALNEIYPHMRADMGTFISNRAGPQAFATWRTANNKLAAMAGELDDAKLRGVLRSSEMTPENVGKMLFSKNRSDVARLYANLDEFGKSRAQGAVLQRAFDKSISANEGLSVERFVNNLSSMGGSVGVVFKGADRARIQGLAKLLDATRQASAASVAPPTGVQNLPAAAGYTLGTLFGSAAIPIAGAGGLLARAYESAPVRNALLRLGKTPKGSKAEGAAFTNATKALNAALSEHAAALNDNIPARSAARQSDQQDNEQQAVPQP